MTMCKNVGWLTSDKASEKPRTGSSISLWEAETGIVLRSMREGLLWVV